MENLINEMKKEIEILNNKCEEILKSQQLIINSLNAYVLPIQNENRKLDSKKNQEDQVLNEMKAVIFYGPILKRKFNLAITPQSHRILQYLKTNNPDTFDGLKRNS